MNTWQQIVMCVLTISLVGLLACSSSTSPGDADDDSEGNNDGDPVAGALTMSVNGGSWTSGALEGTLYIANSVVGLVGSSGNPPSAFSILVNDASGLSTRSYPLTAETGNSQDSFFYFAYSWAVSLDSTVAAFPSPGNPQGTLTITEIDFDARFISGTFTADLYTDDGTGTLTRISEGRFNRVPFTPTSRQPAKVMLSRD